MSWTEKILTFSMITLAPFIALFKVYPGTCDILCMMELWMYGLLLEIFLFAYLCIILKDFGFADICVHIAVALWFIAAFLVSGQAAAFGTYDFGMQYDMAGFFMAGILTHVLWRIMKWYFKD